jgi:hexulose-6-phosphate isomerase
VAIGIENVWNGFLLSPLEMRAFVDSFASPWVFAWYDVGNTLAFGRPEHWIRILDRRIRRLHVKDYRRAVGTAAGFVDLLAGDVEWPAVMAALRAIGYRGWCTAELGPYRHAPQVLIGNTARALAAILAM